MILLVACVTGPGSIELPEADTAEFYATVEPELGASCANPSCHGSVDRPFEVYAVHYHRADPDDTYVDAELSEEEHQLNFDRARAFLAPSDPAQSLLLLKPLDPAEGGLVHGEELVVYLDRSDPGWIALADWAGVE